MSLSTSEAELYLEKMREFTNSKDGLVHTATLQGDDESTRFLIAAGVFHQVDGRNYFGLLIDDSLPVTPAVYSAIYSTIMGATILYEQHPIAVDDPIMRQASERYQAALEMPIIVLGIGRGKTQSFDIMRLYTAPGISSARGLVEIKFRTWESDKMMRLQTGNLSA